MMWAGLSTAVAVIAGIVVWLAIVTLFAAALLGDAEAAAVAE